MTALPANFNWLNRLGLLPRVISEALKEHGVKELAGGADSPVIMGWADEVGEDTIGYRYTGDDVPWCGLFTAVIAKRAGKRIPYGPLYALNWVNFGTPVAVRRRYQVSQPLVFETGKAASLGDVLVFRRPGGGHVGFYIGESDDAYAVLGGNQSNAVTITWIEKSRCVAVRRPAYNLAPASVKPYRIARSGILSKDEA